MAAQTEQPLYTKRLEWSGHAHSSVICTGDFDNWGGSQPLFKEATTGKWVANVKLPYGQKEVKYKFLVDGTWQHATDQQFVNDDAGNTNNVFTVPEAPSAEDLAAAEESTEVQAEGGEKSLASSSEPSDIERDIPKTIQDLFTSASSSDFLGPGIGGGAGQGGQFNHPGFRAYSVANFGITKQMEPLQQNYPSKYLLQGTSSSTASTSSGSGQVKKDNEDITPTDVQIATEYLIAKYKSVHSQAQNRIAIQKQIQEERELKRKNESNGAEDKKLSEIEEGAPSTSATTEAPSETVTSSKPTSNKPKSLPPIQVPGFAKIYSTIKENHLHWVFSEKRLRKIIKEGEEAALSSTPTNSSSTSTSSDHAANVPEAPKESAMLEADRIVKLAGLINSGKYATELVPVSRFDTVLQQELDDQWAATNGLPLPSSLPKPSSTSVKASTPILANGTGLSNGNSEDKENESPSTTTSSSGKNKKKKKSTSSNLAENAASAIVNGVAEGAELLVNKVATSLPATSTTNAVASSSSAALAALTSGPTKRNPTNAVGDVGLKWYGPIKGRGVVARRKFKKGSVIFREDAFAFAPTKSIQTAINEGRGCAYCGKLFSSKAQSLVVPCTAHDHLPTSSTSGARKASSSGARKVSASEKTVAKKDVAAEATEVTEDTKTKKIVCNHKYCNKLCKERATETYGNLLCPVVNPSFAALLRWAETADPRAMKMNPTGVFYIMLRLIVAALKPTPGAQEEALELMRRIECLAAVNERARRGKESGVLADMQYGQDWVTGYRLVMEALQLPDRYYKPANPDSKTEGATKSSTDAEDKEDDEASRAAELFPGTSLKRSEQGGINALPEWYRNLTLPEEMEAKLLGFDNYLVWLGRVALNQEDDGGIYMLHPCMNHECAPNATVRRTPALSGAGAREAKPSRIFVLAQKDIEEGEEITVMYINPSSHVLMRQQILKTDYLFECSCGMCREQLAHQNQSNGRNAVTHNGEADTSAAADPSLASSSNEEDENDVIALAFKAPPGATVDEAYAAKLKTASAHANGSNGHVNGDNENHGAAGEDGAATTTVKLSAATIKKKKKKAAAKLRQEQEAAEAAAKAHALDPMGFFKNDKPSTPWYEEDDI